MYDSESENPWTSDDLDWRDSSDDGMSDLMAEMKHELGRHDSPAFERLRDQIRTPCEIRGEVIAEVVEMLRARCFADLHSYRQYRGEALWSELDWLDEDMLIETFFALWDPLFHRWWQFSALVQHRNAGPVLWVQVLSRCVDIKTVMDIIAAASDRGADSFLTQLRSAIPTLDIVSSAP